MLDVDSGDMAEVVAQVRRGTFQQRYRGGRRVIVMMTTVGPHQLEAVAARIPDSGDSDPVADVRQITATQYGHRP